MTQLNERMRLQPASASASAFSECFFIRSGSVSSPCRNRKEWKGLSAAPMSRCHWTRVFMTKATFPISGNVAERVPELQAVIAGVGLRELRELAVAPVELAGVDDDAADGGAVAADVLRRGERQDVGAVVDGPDEADADGVVDDERDAGLVGDGRELLEVGHVELGVADGLGVERARFRA